MAATYKAQRELARSERRNVQHAPGSASANQIVDLGQPSGGAAKLLPIALYRRFVAGLMRSSGTGTTTQFEIFAATDSAGTGAVQVVAHALAGNKPAAVGDVVWLECDVEQIREVLATATHVGIRTTQGTSGDTYTAFFQRADPFYEKSALTADFVA